MPVRKLKEFLDRNEVPYTVLSHSPAFTAQEVAAVAHVSGRDFAKTVMIRLDGEMAMAVLPANRKVIVEELREITGCEQVKLANEEEFQALFPECEVGAMPPFGNLYGMEVFVAPALAEEREIAFNAGTHTEVMKLAYADFERLVHPRVMSFST